MPSTSHPTILRVQEELDNLKARLASSRAAEIVPDGFRSVGVVYEQIEELLRLPSSQQSIQLCQKKWIEEQLDCSLRLLDLIGAVGENLVSMREHVQDLQSAIRRKGDQVSESKKKAQKIINDSLKSLKLISGQSVRCCVEDGSNQLVKVLIETREITISLLRYMLSLVSEPKTKTSTWSIVSKAITQRKVACEGEWEGATAEENINTRLQASYDCIASKDVSAIRVEKVHIGLKVVEVRMESLESGLQFLFRKLIQNRVSLLNVLSL
ncbi:uncharacterized protein A4U43_C07F24170 [Asparagus officinalis]|uniref:Uncharacterized protein n=1 Tax=Asparagus officinalis TaxID=4686 RepID=A0A5P1EEN1_ASPOF|nr:uncharacterized protein LOC109850859 [Asparagus officinalis]XP_020276526.1 uncharacterized protein LOC109850859 [Asparagus officinalis]ONK64294.1 uncharacterized protein A4U43_C07F24170 [Asparagus officinalis]